MATSHLISSHLISSHLISSHLTSSHLISSHLISPHLISSHLISSHHISPLQYYHYIALYYHHHLHYHHHSIHIYMYIQLLQYYHYCYHLHVYTTNSLHSLPLQYYHYCYYLLFSLSYIYLSIHGHFCVATDSLLVLALVLVHGLMATSGKRKSLWKSQRQSAWKAAIFEKYLYMYGHFWQKGSLHGLQLSSLENEPSVYG